MGETAMDKAWDLVIRGGTVVDGTGSAPFRADVAVKDGLIARIGEVAGRGAEEIDARGRIVTPGFVDIHTHYDGQATWDHHMQPSAWHGVTTVVMGNCGVGFAPCKPEDHDRLIRLMEGVEDIPFPVLTEGLPWNWESFPDYLDSLAARRFDVDIGTQLPHAALRVYVMGERGANREDATPADIHAMAAIAKRAVEAGALGFSTSRTLNHRTSDGQPTPTLTASEDELAGIAMGLAAAGKGTLPFVSDFADPEAEFAMLRRLVERLAHLRDPDFRARLLADGAPGGPGFAANMTRNWHIMFLMGETPDYEQTVDRTIAALAAARGTTPEALALDHMLSNDGEDMLSLPFLNYANGSLDPSHAMLTHPDPVPGLSDGGAHVGMICDGSFPTSNLTHWTRDRTRGPKLSLEAMIRMQTNDTAKAVGLHDRGLIAEGYRADLNVIDYENLTLKAPAVAHDLPAGGRRLLQRADGYVATIVAGQVTYRDGDPTGALPGRLLRGARAAPVAMAAE